MVLGAHFDDSALLRLTAYFNEIQGWIMLVTVGVLFILTKLSNDVLLLFIKQHTITLPYLLKKLENIQKWTTTIKSNAVFLIGYKGHARCLAYTGCSFKPQIRSLGVLTMTHV